MSGGSWEENKGEVEAPARQRGADEVDTGGRTEEDKRTEPARTDGPSSAQQDGQLAHVWEYEEVEQHGAGRRDE